MRKKHKKKLERIIISSAVFIVLFLIYFLIDIFDLYLITDRRFNWIIPFIINLAIYIYIGYDFILKAFNSLKNRNFFDEKIIISVLSILLIIYGGLFSYFNQTIKYFESATLFMILYQLLLWIEAYGMEKYRSYYAEFSKIKPDLVLKVEKNRYVNRPVESITLGDQIVINPESIIPFDGVVVSGTSSLNSQIVLGENRNAIVHEGDKVFSGDYNEKDRLIIKTTSKYEDSVVRKIIDFIEEKPLESNIEKIIAKKSKIFTIVIFIIAAMVATVPSILTHEIFKWTIRGINIFILGCSFRLLNSISLLFSYGITNSALNKVLIKNSLILEKLSKVTTYIFDKSGTLTKGNYEVTNVFPQKNRNKILKTACEAEFNSNHPIAEAIIKAYSGKVTKSYEIEEIDGLGIVATNDKKRILCGNEKLMEKFNIKYINNLSIGTIIYVAENNKFIGSIVISDEIRPESSTVLSYLSSCGAKTILFTGDNERVARDVSDRLMLTDYKASLLHNDKIKALEEIMNAKKKQDIIACVGNNLNEHDLLSKADISISLGGIKASNTADIVVLDYDLAYIQASLEIARKTMWLVYFFIVVSLILKSILFILSLLGFVDTFILISIEMISAIIFMIVSFNCNSSI